MTDIEQVEDNLPVRVMDRSELIDEVGSYFLKGYKPREIAEYIDLSVPTIREYIKIFKQRLEHAADEDPYFLEKVQLNTIKTLAALDDIAKEAWESVEIANRDGMLAQRNQALKLALDVETKRAGLLQLMGGAKTDTEYIARMQKAELVNQMISKVIRDIMSECDNCRERAKVAMREAFAMMNSDDQVMNQEDVERMDIVDGEIIED